MLSPKYIQNQSLFGALIEEKYCILQEKILDNSDYFYEGASCVYKVKIGKKSSIVTTCTYAV